MTKKRYNAVAISVRSLNDSSLLIAYQTELEEEMTTSLSPALRNEVCVVTELYLCFHRCAVLQVSGRLMALVVSQDRAP